jgi:hypothetical protein
MPRASILAAIDAELESLQKARLLLSRIDGATEATASPKTVEKRRTLSAKARKAIANPQKKRWAKFKAAKKTT